MRSEYQALTLDQLQTALGDYYANKERQITLMTGVGGYDQFGISFEKLQGYYRIRIGKKVPRYLRRLGKPRKSVAGYYYWLKKKQA
mgnify:CR=1 FL=1